MKRVEDLDVQITVTEQEYCDLMEIIKFFADRNFPDIPAGNSASYLRGLARRIKAERTKKLEVDA